MHERPAEHARHAPAPPRRVPPAARPGRRPACPACCTRCPAGAPANRLGAGEVARRREQPARRPRRDEPRLGDVLRPRDRQHGRRLRHHGRDAERTRSCSTGWRRSSRASGWSMKAMHRLIVTSATYRQAARVTPELLQRDPRQRAARARPAEPRRGGDGARHGAGGERAARPTRSAGRASSRRSRTGVSELSYGATPWPTSTGARPLAPRAVHVPQAHEPVPRACSRSTRPTSDTACVRRVKSNTPLQALTLLNDKVFVEASQALARRVLKESPAACRRRVANAAGVPPRAPVARRTRTRSRS